MTDNELKALAASNIISIRELVASQKKTDLKFQKTDQQFQKTDKQFQKTDKQFQKTDKQFQKTDQWFQESKQLMRELRESQKETDRQIQATDRQLQETARKLDSIGEMVGGISHNQGDVAEEFFIRGFKETMALGDLHFDHLIKNYAIGHKRLNDEFDIVLVSEDAVIVIEVKYKVHRKDIKKMLEKKLPNFRSLASTYGDHKLYGAIAGFSIPDDVVKEAEQAGLFVIGRSGTNMTLLANHPIPQA